MLILLILFVLYKVSKFKINHRKPLATAQYKFSSKVLSENCKKKKFHDSSAN